MLSFRNSYYILLVLSMVCAADVKGSLEKVASEASSLEKLINGWTSDKGLTGALSIQEKFPDLKNAVTALADSMKSSSGSDIDVDGVKSMVNHVSGLMSSLSSKSGDFKSVGAHSIVSRDISSLTQPTQEIVTAMTKALASDCGKADKLDPVLSSFSNEFSSACQNYGITMDKLPTSNAACKGGSKGNIAIHSDGMLMPGQLVEDSPSSEQSSSPTLGNSAEPAVTGNAQPPVVPANGALSLRPAAAGFVALGVSLLL